MPNQESSNLDILELGSSSNTILSPSLSSPLYSSLESSNDIGTELQLGTPITSPVPQTSALFNSNSPSAKKKSKKHTKRNTVDIENQAALDKIELCGNKCGNGEPVAEWTPSWEDCETVVVSPGQQTSRMYVLGYPFKLQNQDMMTGLIDDIDLLECTDYNEPNEFYTTFSNITGVLKSIENCSSDTSSSEGNLSDIDIIAEFSKSSGHSSPSDISPTMIFG